MRRPEPTDLTVLPLIAGVQRTMGGSFRSGALRTMRGMTATVSTPGAWGIGLATYAADDSVLDVWFPSPALGAPSGADLPELEQLTGRDELRDVRREVVTVSVDDLSAAPADALDAWLRLHLISHRLVQPHGANLDGVFGLLSNVVWTSAGPCAVADFERTRVRLRAAGQVVTVYGVDKFPRMVDYVVPSGVRIADAVF